VRAHIRGASYVRGCICACVWWCLVLTRPSTVALWIRRVLRCAFAADVCRYHVQNASGMSLRPTAGCVQCCTSASATLLLIDSEFIALFDNKQMLFPNQPWRNTRCDASRLCTALILNAEMYMHCTYRYALQEKEKVTHKSNLGSVLLASCRDTPPDPLPNLRCTVSHVRNRYIVSGNEPFK